MLGLSWLAIFGCIAAAEQVGHNTPNIVYFNNKISVVDLDSYKTHPPFDDRWKSPDSVIVVLIAALREKRCPQTLKDMFTKAKYPHRIRAAVIQQNEDGDVDCQLGFCEKMGTPEPEKCEHYDRIRMIRMKAKDAKGPVYARGRQPELVTDDDDFCLQIDAHTDVIQDWDVLMLNDWGAARNEYAVLTTYPSNIKDIGQNVANQWNMPIICGVDFGGKGVIVNRQASACANLERPMLGPLWAAGLSFSRCHGERNVPNDINLKGVFAGEEFARGVRFWTHGYDFYTLTKPFLGTYYGGQKDNSMDFRASESEHTTSLNRMATLLRWPGSDQSEEAIEALGKFKLGTRRTLEQYYKFSGVHVPEKIFNGTCVEPYVPWEDDSLYSEFMNRGQGNTTTRSGSGVTVSDSGSGGSNSGGSVRNDGGGGESGSGGGVRSDGGGGGGGRERSEATGLMMVPMDPIGHALQDQVREKEAKLRTRRGVPTSRLNLPSLIGVCVLSTVILFVLFKFRSRVEALVTRIRKGTNPKDEL